MYRLMDLLYTLLIGLIAGWLASLVMRGGRNSILIYMIIGIIGAFIGGFLFNLVGLAAYGLLGRVIMSTVGAVILIFLLRKLRGI
jgi:uncharacterized membrane protein YeaQ/YmgE (transglycosylase-associated protein family)